MLIEALTKKENFTSNEIVLADFILKDIDAFSSMTSRDLAEKAFVSPPTVSRFCQKLGAKGFSEFKVQLIAEYVERKKQLSAIDYNMPFKKNSSPKEIVSTLSKLSVDAIYTAERDFDYRTVEQVANEIERLKYVDIYASGSSNAIAQTFAEKMTRIGYITTIISSHSEKYIRARQSDPSRVFAIVITYSNATTMAQRCVNYLYDAKVKKLLITGNKHGVSVPKSEYVYLMQSNEQMMLNDKMDVFGEIMMLHFILDSIYAILFQRHYEQNMKKIKETSVYQQSPK